jgi:hypothetical protein
LVDFPQSLPIESTFAGDCGSSNADLGRATAYRCVAGNEVVDPCFADPSGAVGYLLCIDNMSATKAIHVDPTSRQDDPRPSMDHSLPWIVGLVDGQQCVRSSGGQINGQDLNYDCPDGHVYGAPNRASSRWSVAYEPGNSGLLTPVDLKNAYF